jgi:hypothetical protein
MLVDCVEKLRERQTDSDAAQHEFARTAQRIIKLQLVSLYGSDISAPSRVIWRREVFQHYRSPPAGAATTQKTTFCAVLHAFRYWTLVYRGRLDLGDGGRSFESLAAAVEL